MPYALLRVESPRRFLPFEPEEGELVRAGPADGRGVAAAGLA